MDASTVTCWESMNSYNYKVACLPLDCQPRLIWAKNKVVKERGMSDGPPSEYIYAVLKPSYDSYCCRFLKRI
jgi:hypothetical protein